MPVPNFRPPAGICWRPSFRGRWVPRGTADSARSDSPVGRSGRVPETHPRPPQRVRPCTEGPTSSGFTPNRVGAIMVHAHPYPSRSCAHQETWLIHCGDVHAGTIKASAIPTLCRSGNGVAASIRDRGRANAPSARRPALSGAIGIRGNLARVPSEAHRGRFSEMARRLGLDRAEISALRSGRAHAGMRPTPTRECELTGNKGLVSVRSENPAEAGMEDNPQADSDPYSGLGDFAIGTISVGPAAAQTYDPAYPVCPHVYPSWGGSYYECAHTSPPQCNASASGRAAQCVINPYFAGAGEPAGYRRHRRVY
jgi:hypothetical protein